VHPTTESVCWNLPTNVAQYKLGPLVRDVMLLEQTRITSDHDLLDSKFLQCSWRSDLNMSSFHNGVCHGNSCSPCGSCVWKKKCSWKTFVETKIIIGARLYILRMSVFLVIIPNLDKEHIVATRYSDFKTCSTYD
jgi:hypothetical protein